MVKTKYSKYLMNLTKAQAKKLAKNQAILLRPNNMQGGSIEVHMSGLKARKLATALKKNKGLKFSLNPDELNETMGGSAFTDLLKRGVSMAKKEAPKIAKVVAPVVKKQISKVAQKYVDKDTADQMGDLVSKGGVKLVEKMASGLPKGQHLSGVDKNITPDMTGGNIIKDIKKVASKVSKGYKKYVKNTPAGDMIRKGVKTALTVGATELPIMLGQPELAPITGALVNKYGDTLIEKSGLGVLQSNHSNFLNTMHPAMHPTMPTQGITDLPRKGGSFLPAGMRRGGSFLPSGGSFMPAGRGLSGGELLLNPMNPNVPIQGITDVPRDMDGRPIKMSMPSTSFFSGNGVRTKVPTTSY